MGIGAFTHWITRRASLLRFSLTHLHTGMHACIQTQQLEINCSRKKLAIVMSLYSGGGGGGGESGSPGNFLPQFYKHPDMLVTFRAFFKLPLSLFLSQCCPLVLLRHARHYSRYQMPGTGNVTYPCLFVGACRVRRGRNNWHKGDSTSGQYVKVSSGPDRHTKSKMLGVNIW